SSPHVRLRDTTSTSTRVAAQPCPPSFARKQSARPQPRSTDAPHQLARIQNLVGETQPQNARSLRLRLGVRAWTALSRQAPSRRTLGTSSKSPEPQRSR